MKENLMNNRKKKTLKANKQLHFILTNNRSLSAFCCKMEITGGTSQCQRSLVKGKRIENLKADKCILIERASW